MMWLLLAALVWPNVPMPDFGLEQLTPAPTVWVTQTGSDSNPGTQAKPRQTIPRVLTPGMVVRVIGTLSLFYTSPNTLECRGTAANPAWILGGNVGGEISGSYCIVEGVGAPGWTITGTRDGRPSDRIVFRHGGGVGATYGIQNNFGVAPISNIVLWDMTGCGTYDGTQTEADGDNHGVGVGKRATNIWVADSNFSRCSGDAVQINGGQGGQDDTGPVYIVNLTADRNRQSGVGIKQSHDVTISGGHFTNMRPDATFTNPGAGIVAQYWAKRLIVVGTVIEHSENCVVVAGYDLEAFATFTSSGIGLFGVTCRDIHATRSKFDPADSRSPGNAFTLVGASSRWLQGNLIDGADGGISIAYQPPPEPTTGQLGTTLKDNTILNIGPAKPAVTPGQLRGAP